MTRTRYSILILSHSHTQPKYTSTSTEQGIEPPIFRLMENPLYFWATVNAVPSSRFQLQRLSWGSRTSHILFFHSCRCNTGLWPVWPDIYAMCMDSQHVSLQEPYEGGFFLFFLTETDVHAWMSKYEVVGNTLSNDREARGQIPCALCPIYTASSITSIYTPHHWQLSALGWYSKSINRSFFFYFCFKLLNRKHVGWNSTRKQNT